MAVEKAFCKSLLSSKSLNGAGPRSTDSRGLLLAYTFSLFGLGRFVFLDLAVMTLLYIPCRHHAMFLQEHSRKLV